MAIVFVAASAAAPAVVSPSAATEAVKPEDGPQRPAHVTNQPPPPPPASAGRPRREAALKAALGKLGETFEARARAHGIVGASLRVVAAGSGSPLLHRTFGHQDRAANVATTDNTIYHWASITKTLTGIAIMQLRDRGLVGLDIPIVKYVPELRAASNPFGPMDGITARHLLSHTAGFRAGTWPWGGSEPWHPHEPTEWSQLVAMMPYTQVEFAPGSKYGYSNPGIVFLGIAIERVSGEPWEVYVEKNILRPLGMSRSFFDRAPYHLLQDRSRSYWISKGGLSEARFDFDTGITVSNGGLNAPLGDMEKYLQFLLGAAASRDAAAVLSRSSLEEMWRPVVQVMDSPIPGDTARVDMGLTFFIEQRGGRTLIAHSGSQGGFVSHFFIEPSAGVGYVVAFNTHAQDEPPAPNTRVLDGEVLDAFVRDILPIFPAR